jgi:hypothetical protein
LLVLLVLVHILIMIVIMNKKKKKQLKQWYENMKRCVSELYNKTKHTMIK